jgi:hypothetical protein
MADNTKSLNTILLGAIICLLSWNVLQTHNSAVDLAALKASVMPATEIISRFERVDDQFNDIHLAFEHLGYKDGVQWPTHRPVVGGE